MAAYTGLTSTLSAGELVHIAEQFAVESEQIVDTIAGSFQCLLSLWKHIKPLSLETNVERLATDLTPPIVRFREQFNDTEAFQTVVKKMWLAAAYIHCTKNACNLIPLLTSEDVLTALTTRQRELGGDTSVNALDDETDATRIFCAIFAGVYVVIDQLSIHPGTRERMEYLTGPILQLLMRSILTVSSN